ncbi:monovalent cation/H+ antiporter complex subunit F [Plebeiibacterium marinum]|uniref:Monovalent cation/H+ antiporter complex subunit F n=1 Tax=Plebeiibacterium marinum TaxID=2992111 RepID=A0AAE3SIH8_9BACT|nr:monovalent cation/H+ antiporter complex subunit F [Plebeiobacterium marinum]MCW3804725.1 monovalent cation/H+ antiporter complex subunit F [Plebeiobacterium marinum]
MDFGVLDLSIFICFTLMLLALLFAFIRLVKGPSTFDRIAAMDLMASITMGFVLIYSIVISNGIYVDIAIVISLISFIGTVAISTYLKQKNTKK